MNTLTKSLIALGLSGLASVSSANNQIYIDVAGTGITGIDFDAGVCATCSGQFNQLGFSYNSETIITTGGALPSDGDPLTTTGGFNYSNAVWDVNNVDLNGDPNNPNASFPNNQVSTMIPGTATAGLTGSVGLIDSGTSFWGLGFTLNLTGNMLGTDNITYTGGLIEVFAIVNDPVDAGQLIAKNIFDLTVKSGGPGINNYLVTGNVSTGGTYAEDAAFANFFHMVGADCAGDNSFIGLTNCAPPIEISFVLDQNLDNPNFLPGPGAGEFTLIGDHNGSVDFSAAVPEPGPLALIGLGLFGIGLVRRIKKA